MSHTAHKYREGILKEKPESGSPKPVNSIYDRLHVLFEHDIYPSGMIYSGYKLIHGRYTVVFPCSMPVIIELKCSPTENRLSKESRKKHFMFFKCPSNIDPKREGVLVTKYSNFEMRSKYKPNSNKSSFP